MSLTASRRTSLRRRSPKPVMMVSPPGQQDTPTSDRPTDTCQGGPIKAQLCTLGQRRPARHDDVAKQGLPQVHVGAIDGIHHDLVDSWIFQPHQLGIEQYLGRAESRRTELLPVSRWPGKSDMHTLALRVLPSGSLYSSAFAPPPVPAHSFSSFLGSWATKHVFSLMSRTISFSAEVWNMAPDFRSRVCRCSVTSRPATSIRRMADGMAKPSKTGTACETPSPESRTMPVVRPEAYLSRRKRIDQLPRSLRATRRRETNRARTAWMEMKTAGTLKLSKNIWTAVSRLARGFRGASVNSSGCYTSPPNAKLSVSSRAKRNARSLRHTHTAHGKPNSPPPIAS